MTFEAEEIEEEQLSSLLYIAVVVLQIDLFKQTEVIVSVVTEHILLCFSSKSRNKALQVTHLSVRPSLWLQHKRGQQTDCLKPMINSQCCVKPLLSECKYAKTDRPLSGAQKLNL